MVVSFKLETDAGILVEKVGLCLTCTVTYPEAPYCLVLTLCLPCSTQAAGALQAYGVHLVVANLLHSRKERVLLVTSAEAPWRASDAAAVVGGAGGAGEPFATAVETLDRPKDLAVIEELLVPRVVAMHAAFRAAGADAGPPPAQLRG
jgi:hypothetical protein